MRYLLTTTETYRVDSEDELIQLIETEKANNTVTKCNYQQKEKKQKGEVVDAWYKVSITKVWCDEKAPTDVIEVKYERGSAF